MKKAIIVEFNLATRVVIDTEKEDIDNIMKLAKPKIQEKLDNNELGDNLGEWYDDEEMPYEAEKELDELDKIENLGQHQKFCLLSEDGSVVGTTDDKYQIRKMILEELSAVQVEITSVGHMNHNYTYDIEAIVEFDGSEEFTYSFTLALAVNY